LCRLSAVHYPSTVDPAAGDTTDPWKLSGVRERIGYLIAAAAIGLAVIVNAVAPDDPTGTEKEAQDIASATQRMGQRWDSEQIDDVRRAIKDVDEAATRCNARASATTVALLAAIERAGDPVLTNWVDELVEIGAIDGVLRRGVRARLRDHREFKARPSDPCVIAVRSARKVLKRHREREIVIARAAERLVELGESRDTADRFANPELPLREQIGAAARR
jgi:hypothetical protein